MKEYVKAKKTTMLRMVSGILAVIIVFTCIPFPAKAETRAVPEIGDADNLAEQVVILNDKTIVQDLPITVSENTKGFFENLAFGESDSYCMSIAVSATYDGYMSDVRLAVGRMRDGSTIEIGMRPCTAYSDGQFITGPWQAVIWKSAEAGAEGEPLAVAGGLSAPAGAKEENNVCSANYVCTIEYNAGKISMWIDAVQIFNKEDISSRVEGIVLQPGFHAYEALNVKISELKIWGDVTEANVAGMMIVENNGRDDTASYLSDGKIVTLSDTKGTFKNMKFGSDRSYWMTAEVSGIYEAEQDDLRLIIGKMSDGSTVEIGMRPCTAYTTGFTTGTWQAVVWKTAGAGQEGSPMYVKGECKAPDNSKVENDVCKASYRCAVKYDNGRISFWIDGENLFDNVDLSAELADILLQLGFHSYGLDGTLSNIKIWGDIEVINDAVLPTIGTSRNAAYGMTVTSDGRDITKEYEDSVEKEEETGGFDIADEEVITYGELKFGTTNTYYYSADVDTDATAWNSVRMILGSGIDSDGSKRMIQVCARPTDGEDWQTVIFLRRQDGNEIPIEETVTYITPPSSLVNYRYTVKYADGKVSFWLNSTPLLKDIKVDDVVSDIELTPGFYAQGKAATISNIDLWGDVEATREFGYVDPRTVEPTIGTAVNMADTMVVMNNGVNETAKYRRSKEISVTADTVGTFGNLKFGADSYFYSAYVNTVKDYSGTEDVVAYGSIRLRVGYGINTNNGEQTIEVCIRPELGQAVIFLYGGGETVVDFTTIPNLQFDKNYRHTIKIAGDRVSFWLDGMQIFDDVVIPLKDIHYAPGFYSQCCDGTISNIKLWGEGIEPALKVPEKPASNGDYADDMYIKNSAVVSYENGILSSATDKYAETAIFEYLPFTVNDTYVLGFDVTVTKADEPHQGPRIIIGTDTKGNDIDIFFTEYAVMLVDGSEPVREISFQRELGKSYRFDILIEPTAVSLWVDDVLLIEQCRTPEKATTKTGVLFELAKATMWNFDIYYTDVVKYVKPEVPQKPVLKRLGKEQYNAAEWMKVYLENDLYQGYFGNRLASADSSRGIRYMFDNMPITDEMSYYYTATYKITESSANHKGPRFIFRYSDATPMYIAITQGAVVLLAGSEAVMSAPFESKVGGSHDIAIYSTPDTVTVWVDGAFLMDQVDLSAYCQNGVLRAKMGILFEMCQAEITNLAIYGDKIKFDPAYVDMELYNDKFYRMSGIPSMPKFGINLFQNITMIDNSGGKLGATYDKENRVFKTEYGDSVGEVVFVDAKGSFNLNGLPNKKGHVFSFTYKVEDYQAERIENTGFWLTLGRSDTPYSMQRDNELRVGITGTDLLIHVYEEGELIREQNIPFRRNTGQAYHIAIVHGVNWMKLYVDNELKMVATQLPTYDVKFAMVLHNMQSTFSDFQLYEFESSGLSVRETKITEKVEAGKTIYDAQEYKMHSELQVPYVLIVTMSGVIVCSAAGIVLLVIKHNRRKKGAVNNA